MLNNLNHKSQENPTNILKRECETRPKIFSILIECSRINTNLISDQLQISVNIKLGNEIYENYTFEFSTIAV